MSTANAPPAQLTPAPSAAPLQCSPAWCSAVKSSLSLSRLQPQAAGADWVRVYIDPYYGGWGIGSAQVSPLIPARSRNPSLKVQLGAAPTHKLPWQIISHYLPAQSNAHHTTPSPDSKRAAYVRDSEIPAARTRVI